MTPTVRYELVARCPHTRARLGRLHTPHGPVDTPAFMPVGTRGAVRLVGFEDLEALGYRLVLSNTYHLALRPGSALIRDLGGLHRFSSWSGAILTDSGGFQAMSLSKMARMDDHAVTFRSHLDGSPVELTPERAMRIQAELGVDVSMVLDHCAPFPCTRELAEDAVRRTTLWAQRSLEARAPGQAAFGIVQGGVHPDLRERSATEITSLPFEGFAIGGVSVGEPTELQRPVVAHTAPLLPEDKPRYLMGVGHPQDILHAVACGVDLFDCVLPTRMARHHCLYTLRGRVNALNARWERHDGPFDPDSAFPMTARYSAAYLRHLFKAGEELGARIASLHNLAFYGRLMAEIRQAIAQGTWPNLVERYRNA
ncbi:MAG: tRNA guanosine(34) transglycosylase Tgt [Fimbriimonadales bacterium]|nr:tRNA guanosine(34) transglycosylase Tgt [Fimbriimonadales bacterium]